MRKICIISLFVFLLDFVTKRLVLHFLVEDESFVLIKNFFSLTYVKNTGVAFSFFKDNVFFIILMTLLVLFFLFQYIRMHVLLKIEKIGYSFIIGGALGNLFDRFFYGYVVDFFDFYLFGYHYPIFNVADVFVVIGVFFIFLVYVRNGGGHDEVSS